MTTTPENTGPTPRPNSKRSDPDWLTRTYFLEKTTDIEVEAELIKLRRDGIEMDKSDLVNSVLKGWVAGRRGQVPESDTTEAGGMEEVPLGEVLMRELDKLQETACVIYSVWRRVAPDLTGLLASQFAMLANWKIPSEVEAQWEPEPHSGLEDREMSLVDIVNARSAKVQDWARSTTYVFDYQALTEDWENPPSQDDPLLVFEVSRQWLTEGLESWFEHQLIVERIATIRKSLNLVKGLPEWVDPEDLYRIVAELDQALRIVDQQFPYNVNPEPPF
jgi:hypothetical protein